MSPNRTLLALSAGLAGVYLALTAWMSAHAIGAWASSGAAAFCGFGVVALIALSGTGCPPGAPGGDVREA